MSPRNGHLARAWVPSVLVGLAVFGLTLHTGRSLGSPPQQPTCSDDSYEPDNECAGYSLRLFRVGATERHQLCDRDWVHFEAVDGTRYRIETSGLAGGADTALELWGLDSSHCGSQLAFDDNGGGGLASRIDWTASAGSYAEYNTGHLLVAEANEAYADGMGYQLTIKRIERSYVVPVLAHAGGAGGELWVSDLWLYNPTDSALELDLVFTPTGAAGPQHELSRPVTVAAGETLTLTDPLASLFETGGTGWLEVRSPGVDLVVASRICSDGTCQAVPVPAREDARLEYDDVLLPVTGTAHGRTNLGLAELRGDHSTVTIQMRAESGSFLGERDLDLPPRAHLQVNDVFAFLTVERQDGVVLSVHPFGGSRVAVYASVVDGQSSDASFVAPTGQGDMLGYRVVPLACGGSSDLETELLVSGDYVASNFTVKFLPPAGSGQQPAWFEHGVGHYQTVTLDDVVTGLGGEGCGALVVYGSRRLISRTFRRGAAGTLGDVVPVALDREVVGRGDGPLTVLGVERSATTVTTLGWVNPTSHSGTLAVRLVPPAGVTYVVEAPVEAERAGQIEVAPLGPPGVYRAELEVVEGEARIAGYAMVTDLESGDFVVQPALPVPRPHPEDVYVSSWEALPVDQLPAAVGVDALPAGTFTATVSGAGDLGADDLPIHVACLFHGPDGRLRSAALAIGETVSDVGGDQPFWCFIPDWIRSDDNWGAVEVTLQGPQTVTFQLDPIANSVLLDREPRAVIEAAPAASYVLETDADFGGPLMVPQLLVMAKEATSHALDVVTLENGDQLGPLWTSSQLLAVGLDLGTYTDNRGSLWLRAQPPAAQGAAETARSAKETRAR